MEYSVNHKGTTQLIQEYKKIIFNFCTAKIVLGKKFCQPPVKGAKVNILEYLNIS